MMEPALGVPRLVAIRARLDQAHPGPWVTGDCLGRWRQVLCHSDEQWTQDKTYREAADGGWVLAAVLGQANATFIAHARADVEYLLRQVEATER
jgi:hypothetical protein